MPPDQLIRARLSLGAIWLEKLPEGRRDPRRAKEHLEEAIRIGEATAELDAELGKALWLYALLRHFDVGVSAEQARRALRRALELGLPEDSKRQIREELERTAGSDGAAAAGGGLKEPEPAASGRE
jgi:hypothetical protein